MRNQRAFYADRTAYLAALEEHPHAIFLRPQRFGKTLWLSTMRCHFDVNDLDIAGQPHIPHLRSSFYVLSFTFPVSFEGAQHQERFSSKLNADVKAFLRSFDLKATRR